MFFGVQIPHPTHTPKNKLWKKKEERGLYIAEFNSIKSAKRKGKIKNTIVIPNLVRQKLIN